MVVDVAEGYGLFPTMVVTTVEHIPLALLRVEALAVEQAAVMVVERVEALAGARVAALAVAVVEEVRAGTSKEAVKDFKIP